MKRKNKEKKKFFGVKPDIRFPLSRIILKCRNAGDEHCIGVILPNVTDYQSAKVIKSLNDVFQAAGFSLRIRSSDNNQAKEEKIIKDMILKYRVSGLIIEPAKSQMLCKHIYLFRKLDFMGIPVVFLRSTYPQLFDRPKLIIDDTKGSYLLTRHLIATGRKNILGVFKADDARGFERHKGYVQALQEAGIAYRPENLIWFHSEEKFKKAEVVLGQLLKQTPKCDGIVCYNDFMAEAIMHFLSENGIKVPEDIAVTGYGNMPSCDGNKIGITSVELPDRMLGLYAGQLMIDMLEGCAGRMEPMEIVLDPEIVIKESSVC